MKRYLSIVLRKSRAPFTTTSLVSSSRPIYIQSKKTMASDEDYTAFLEKANQTTSSTANTQSSSHSKSLTTNTVNTTVPTTLNKIEAYYTSDTDERFEPVALQYAGGELDKGQFFYIIPPFLII